MWDEQLPLLSVFSGAECVTSLGNSAEGSALEAPQAPGGPAVLQAPGHTSGERGSQTRRLAFPAGLRLSWSWFGDPLFPEDCHKPCLLPPGSPDPLSSAEVWADSGLSWTLQATSRQVAEIHLETSGRGPGGHAAGTLQGLGGVGPTSGG